ncbi:hypothetical protein FORMA_14730 [Formosa sp. Hel3_A1_48]|nr:hypothetical protein FORMA_14730 [Formosa sp. Hel3_A1_48]
MGKNENWQEINEAKKIFHCKFFRLFFRKLSTEDGTKQTSKIIWMTEN